MTCIKRIPLAIDCDPGIDDAWALLLAAALEDFDIRLLAPVAGNVDYCYTSDNLRRLAEWAGIPGRLVKGASKALEIEDRRAEVFHGSNGMANFELPQSARELEPVWAWDALYEEAVRAEAEGGLVVLAVGPLTNLALALEKYPDLAGRLRGIQIMGGCYGQGNHSRWAEFNIWSDPHAAEVVFQSGVPLRIVTLDSTNASGFTAEEMAEIRRLKTPFDGLLDAIAAFFPGNYTLHDALAAVSLSDPEMIAWEPASLFCECEDEEQSGRTVISFDGGRTRPGFFAPLSEQGPRTAGRALISREVRKDRYMDAVKRGLSHYAEDRRKAE